MKIEINTDILRVGNNTTRLKGTNRQNVLRNSSKVISACVANKRPSK